MQIITYPNPILRKKSRDLTQAEISSPEIKQLISDMYNLMRKKDGVGLAAPQIGKNINLFVINVETQNLHKTTALINPKIISGSWRKSTEQEGCLSIPGTFGQVKRPRRIKVKAINQNHQPIQFKATDLLARVIQHEYDHLGGVLFIDKMLEKSK